MVRQHVIQTTFFNSRESASNNFNFKLNLIFLRLCCECPQGRPKCMTIPGIDFESVRVRFRAISLPLYAVTGLMCRFVNLSFKFFFSFVLCTTTSITFHMDRTTSARTRMPLRRDFLASRPLWQQAFHLTSINTWSWLDLLSEVRVKHTETFNSIHRVFTPLTHVSAVWESAYRNKTVNIPHKYSPYELLLLMALFSFTSPHLFSPFSRLPHSSLFCSRSAFQFSLITERL